MNCNRFRSSLPDWLRGDLKETEAGHMAEHSHACRACAREEALERHLRSVWKSVPDSPAAPEMWPRVAAALDQPSRLRQPLFRPARLAMASAFAFGALCAVLYTQRIEPDNGSASTMTVDSKQNVIEVFQELKQLPDPDRERTALGPPHLRHAAMILGEGDGR